MSIECNKVLSSVEEQQLISIIPTVRYFMEAGSEVSAMCRNPFRMYIVKKNHRKQARPESPQDYHTWLL